MTLMANEVYMITRLAKLRGVKLSESAVPAVGTLLIFALVITPAATANILAGSPFKAMVIASVLCLVSIWAGLVLSAMFPAPPSFIIVTLSTLFWAIAKAVETMRK